MAIVPDHLRNVPENGCLMALKESEGSYENEISETNLSTKNQS